MTKKVRAIPLDEFLKMPIPAKVKDETTWTPVTPRYPDFGGPTYARVWFDIKRGYYHVHGTYDYEIPEPINDEETLDHWVKHLDSKVWFTEELKEEFTWLVKKRISQKLENDATMNKFRVQ